MIYPNSEEYLSHHQAFERAIELIDNNDLGILENIANPSEEFLENLNPQQIRFVYRWILLLTPHLLPDELKLVGKDRMEMLLNPGHIASFYSVEKVEADPAVLKAIKTIIELQEFQIVIRAFLLSHLNRKNSLTVEELRNGVRKYRTNSNQ